MRSWTHRWTWGVYQHRPGAAAGGEGQTGKSSAAAWRGAAQRPGSLPTAGEVHQRAAGYWSSAVSVGKWVSDGFKRRRHTFLLPHSEKGLLEVHQVHFGLRKVSVFAAQLKHPQHQQQGAVLRCIKTSLIQEIWLLNKTSHHKTVLVNEQEVPGKTITMETVLNMRMNHSHPLEEFKASKEGPDAAPPQQRPPYDGQVVECPMMMLWAFVQVRGGFTGGDVINRCQNPHTQAS